MRCIAVIFGAAPVVFCLASLVDGLAEGAAKPWNWFLPAVLALLIGGLNFHLSFIRPAIYQRRHQTLDGYRFISVYALVGNVLAMLAISYGYGAVGTSVVALIAVCIDTGGLPWFIYGTWRDESMWDV